ncbi:MAG: CYTH domain-containing protein [Desulfococcaceae bacterium]|jgi:adenylate cyclase class IV|nr:CYTH domain-containing protein [Desulfococcaceae bacterium]
MLVFQKNTDHILEDGCIRADMDPRWLVEVIAEMNLYLPDDWRLTRTRSNFRIQIVSHQSATLVGSCFRTEQDEILHIIDSLHLKHFHDCVDLRNRPEKIRGRVNRKEHPDVITPNLYFFRPGPEGFSSPLFARQYERIRIKKDGSKAGDQYHRIHPLTRAGLDLEHFMWIRWTVSGQVSVVESPDPSYHGKDYWMIDPLETDSKRGNRAAYLRTYESVLKKYRITLPEAAEKAATPYETEFKFLAGENEKDAAAVFDLITEALEKGTEFTGFTVSDQDRRHKQQTDIYFDDENFTLFHSGASFRLRKKDSIRVTLKKRFPKGEGKDGLYRRIEEEAVITVAQEAELMRGSPINAFPYRLLPYIAPNCKLLQAQVFVSNERRIFHIRDEKYRRAEICFDRVNYRIAGKDHGPFFEVEIESKGAPREKIAKLAEYLRDNMGLEPSQQSKYERGVGMILHKSR